MDQHVIAVSNMQEYINNNLYEDITLLNLSEVSLYSPWYSYRLFTQLLGMTPAEYIRKLRLSKSALKLRDENVRITDIAFECGFSDISCYQRAFRKEFGCNPKEYSKNPIPLYLFTPFGIKKAESEKLIMENIKNVFIQVIEKPKRKVLIKRGIKAQDYFSYCGEVGCDVWGLLTSIKAISGEPVCLWLPKKYILPETSEYVQGVEVELDYNGPVPDGFDIIILPAAKYLMFQGEPFAEENFEDAICQLKASIEKYDPASIGYEWDSDNPKIQLEPIGKRGYIELLAIK